MKRFHYKDKVIVTKSFYSGLSGEVINERDRGTENPNDQFRWAYEIRLVDGKEIWLYPHEMKAQGGE